MCANDVMYIYHLVCVYISIKLVTDEKEMRREISYEIKNQLGVR